MHASMALIRTRGSAWAVWLVGTWGFSRISVDRRRCHIHHYLGGPELELTAPTLCPSVPSSVHVSLVAASSSGCQKDYLSWAEWALGSRRIRKNTIGNPSGPGCPYVLSHVSHRGPLRPGPCGQGTCPAVQVPFGWIARAEHWPKSFVGPRRGTNHLLLRSGLKYGRTSRSRDR